MSDPVIINLSREERRILPEVYHKCLPVNFSISDFSDDCPSYETMQGIIRDVLALKGNPLPGIWYLHEEEKIKELHAMIQGTEGSPYEGGFFLFYLLLPNNYPLKPPLISLVTTDRGRVRFGPSLHPTGRVELRLIGTILDDEWTSTHTLSSTLLEIQKLFCNNKLVADVETRASLMNLDISAATLSQQYNEFLVHETMRVAVVGMLSNPVFEPGVIMHSLFRRIMKEEFLKKYDFYVTTCTQGVARESRSSRERKEPLFGAVYEIAFDTMLPKLRQIKEDIEQELEDIRIAEEAILNEFQ